MRARWAPSSGACQELFRPEALNHGAGHSLGGACAVAQPMQSAACGPLGRRAKDPEEKGTAADQQRGIQVNNNRKMRMMEGGWGTILL